MIPSSSSLASGEISARCLGCLCVNQPERIAQVARSPQDQAERLAQIDCSTNKQSERPAQVAPLSRKQLEPDLVVDFLLVFACFLDSLARRVSIFSGSNTQV